MSREQFHSEDDGAPQAASGQFAAAKDGEQFAVLCPGLRFVESDEFALFISAVIGSNIFVLACETDMPDYWLWALCDNLFLFVFFVEMFLRLGYRGSAWYQKDRGWAVFDTVIVAMGVFDLWVTPLLLRGRASRSRTSLLRFLRLARLLRLLRIFKMFPKLMQVMGAIVAVLGTFSWIFSVLFLFMVCNAIVLTHLLGHGEALPAFDEMTEHMTKAAYAESRHLVQTMFRNVLSSVFTLFQVTTTDNWNGIANPVVAFNPLWRLFFVFYIAFASWTMISVLTAIAADSMIEATSNRKDMEVKEQEQKQKAFVEFLRNAFYEADVDGNGVLDEEEFRDMMEKDTVHQEMARLGVNLSQADLYKAWTMLDIDDSGELTIEEFVSGLAYLQEGLSTKHVISIDYELKRVAIRLGVLMEQLREDVGDVQKQNSDIEESLKCHEENCEQLELYLWLWQEWSKAVEPGAIPPDMVKMLPDMPPPLAREPSEELPARVYSDPNLQTRVAAPG